MNIITMNTDFEEELQTGQTGTALQKKARFSQMEFLGLLLCEEEDRLVLQHFPEQEEAKRLLSHPLFSKRKHKATPWIKEEELSSFPQAHLKAWAYSSKARKLAEKYKLSLQAPPLSLIKKFNDKRWLQSSVPFQESALIRDLDELDSFLQTSDFKSFVLKQPFAFGGLGMRKIQKGKLSLGLHSWLKNSLEQHSIIIEPFVEVLASFSSLWEIFPSGGHIFLSWTKQKLGPAGQFLGCCIDQECPKDFLPYEKEHLQAAEKLIEELQKEGYFGFLGLDTFVYQDKHSYKLRAIAEVNARCTFGILAFKAKQLLKKQNLCLSLSKKAPKENAFSLLPKKLLTKKSTLNGPLHLELSAF